ncbi:hypothetical protein HMPREF0880_03417 [Yokenella regensburgei ATCC 43003]|nr:hypothetical protein HMPREF0880_03417 [Yokenella regensburgei ATCC 43003]
MKSGAYFFVAWNAGESNTLLRRPFRRIITVWQLLYINKPFLFLPLPIPWL